MSISRQLPQPDPLPRPATSPVDNRLFFGSGRFHLMIHEAGTQHTETSGLERSDAQHSHFLETHGLKKCTVIVTGDFPTMDALCCSQLPFICSFLLFTAQLWRGALAMWNSNLQMALYDQLGRQSFSSSSTCANSAHL